MFTPQLLVEQLRDLEGSSSSSGGGGGGTVLMPRC
jgi:hypothetical protein